LTYYKLYAAKLPILVVALGFFRLIGKILGIVVDYSSAVIAGLLNLEVVFSFIPNSLVN